MFRADGLAGGNQVRMMVGEFMQTHRFRDVAELPGALFGPSRLAGGNRNTLKQHFRALVERGHLSQHGSGRGVWYELR